MRSIKSLQKVYVGFLLVVLLGFSLKTFASTIISITVPDWQWEMEIQSANASTETVVAMGEVVMQFDSNGFFDFGTELNPNTLPLGPNEIIDIEIISMSLVGNAPILGGNFSVGLAQPSLGGITALENQGGTLVGNSFLDIFVEFDLIDQNMVLISDMLSLNMTSTLANGPPANDVLWMPFFLWDTFTVNTPQLRDQFGVPWDSIVTVHTQIPGMAWDVPEPSSFALLALGLAWVGVTRRRKYSCSQVD